MSSQPIEYRWRGPVTDAEMVMLVQAHGGRPVAGWRDQVRPYSLGWVTARPPGQSLAHSSRADPVGYSYGVSRIRRHADT